MHRSLTTPIMAGDSDSAVPNVENVKRAITYFEHERDQLLQARLHTLGIELERLDAILMENARILTALRRTVELVEAPGEER